VRRERFEDEERGGDEEDEEERVVIENGESGRFVIRDLVLFPQDTLVLLFLRHFFVVSQSAHHLFRYSFFPFNCHLVLEDVLRLAISKCHEPSANDSHD